MKILLADDHELIRAGLRNELAAFDAAVEFVEASDAESLGRVLDEHADLDLALVDLGMPGMEGASSIAEVCRAHPTVPIIVLSGADPGVAAEQALRAGAAGFIPKTAVSRVLVQAIRLVLAGGQYVPPQALRELDSPPLFKTWTAADTPGVIAPPSPGPPRLAAPSSPAPASPWSLDMLSGRQREVFELLATGLSNKAIAQRLDVTEGTVKSHVAAIFDVLHVHNRVSAVAEARRLLETAQDRTRRP